MTLKEKVLEVFNFLELNVTITEKEEGVWRANIRLESKKEVEYKNELNYFVKFYFDSENKRLIVNNIHILGDLSGKGYARKSVEAIEKICKDLNCNSVEVLPVFNKGFWENFGYSGETILYAKDLSASA